MLEKEKKKKEEGMKWEMKYSSAGVKLWLTNVDWKEHDLLARWGKYAALR